MPRIMLGDNAKGFCLQISRETSKVMDDGYNRGAGSNEGGMAIGKGRVHGLAGLERRRRRSGYRAMRDTITIASQLKPILNQPWPHREVHSNLLLLHRRAKRRTSGSKHIIAPTKTRRMTSTDLLTISCLLLRRIFSAAFWAASSFQRADCGETRRE